MKRKTGAQEVGDGKPDPGRSLWFSDAGTQARGHGLRMTLVGLVLGLALSLAVTRFLRHQLLGVAPTDALTYAGVAVLLTLVALAACYIPARRATKVEPTATLCCE
jgi:ABC-type lipoprotein release transport system permease subunit